MKNNYEHMKSNR